MQIRKTYCEELGDYYLIVKYRTNRFGSWTEWFDEGQFVKVIGNKVYGDAYYLFDRPNETMRYLMYDFDTWNEGETIRFESVSSYLPDNIYVENIKLGTAQYIVTDPEGKYYSFLFSGQDPEGGSTIYIKGIGRVQDRYVPNLVFYYYPICAHLVDYGTSRGLMALKVWHPDLGVLYQHPDYEKYAGVNSLTADEAEEAVITAESGEVTVESAQPVEVMTCTTTGVTVRRDKVTGSATYPLAPGIYIVRAGSRTSKVCI